MKTKILTKFFKKILLTFCAGFALISFGFAQIAPEDFKINITPKNPKTGETYLLFLDEYNADINKADIAWVLDNNLVKKGFGLTSQAFIMKESVSQIDVFVTTPSGAKYNKRIKMIPKSISLSYEGLNSYAPYWYEGKRLSTPGDRVRVHAFASIIDGKDIISDKDLYFTWELNEEIIKGGGLGVNYIDIDMPDSADNVNEVSVTVSPRLSSDSISEKISVKLVSPEVLIMRRSGENTLYSNNLSGTLKASQNSELSLVGIPLFYNILDKLNYNWVINNKNNNTTSNIRTLKLPDAGGKASVKLKIDNDKKLMQYGESELLINF